MCGRERSSVRAPTSVETRCDDRLLGRERALRRDRRLPRLDEARVERGVRRVTVAGDELEALDRVVSERVAADRALKARAQAYLPLGAGAREVQARDGRPIAE